MIYRMIFLAEDVSHIVLVPRAAHNNKEKPLSSNSLLLNGAYLSI